MQEEETNNNTSLIILSDRLAKSAHAIHVVNKLISDSKSRLNFEGKLSSIISVETEFSYSNVDFDFYKKYLVYYDVDLRKNS